MEEFGELTEWNAIKQRNGRVTSVVGVIKPLSVGSRDEKRKFSRSTGDDEHCMSRGGHGGLLGQAEKLT